MMPIWVVDCSKSVLRDLAKENAVGFGLWLPPIGEINGFLFLDFPKMSAVTLTRMKKKLLKS
jgi:hypothetical protein